MTYRYVGQTVNPKDRLTQHLADASFCRNYPNAKASLLQQWFHELKSVGLRPVQIVLEEVSPRKAIAAERSWIHFYRSMQYELLNSEKHQPSKKRLFPAIRSCLTCGQEFLPARPASKFCSLSCSNKSYRLAQKGRPDGN